MAQKGGRNWDQDLRYWMEAVDAEGALKRIDGAEPMEEIGGILDLYQRRMGNEAVLFDEVPGFPVTRKRTAPHWQPPERVRAVMDVARSKP